jgi:hypothetical protein
MGGALEASSGLFEASAEEVVDFDAEGCAGHGSFDSGDLRRPMTEKLAESYASQ